MSDIMRPMPYKHLLDWVLEEYKKSGSIFGISKFVKHTNGQALPIFDTPNILPSCAYSLSTRFRSLSKGIGLMISLICLTSLSEM